MADTTAQRKAFYFLVQKEKGNADFSIDEINQATGWSGSTFSSYKNKRLKGIIHRNKNNRFTVNGLIDITENEFIEHLQQTAKLTPKSRQLADLLNETDNKYLIQIINKGNIDLLKKLLEIAIGTDNKESIFETLKIIFSNSKGEEREKLLKGLKNQNLTKNDIDIITGRKEGLEVFYKQLFNKSEWKETDWQVFFETNTWIFGYGIDYKFLRILQREARISDVTVSGEEQVIVDYLVGDRNFTTLVELKRPDTPLFDKVKNRSGCWRLSKDLMNAVSQILEQKAVWQIKSQNKQFDKDRKLIKQKTIDPKIILIIGDTKQFGDEGLDQEIKSNTFELFRRNQRNIEFITYDELYDRANFIVNHQ
jgi:hypothetical protein